MMGWILGVDVQKAKRAEEKREKGNGNRGWGTKV
jgi:hypothetical protein